MPTRLTEQEQQEIVRYIEADKPLPDKYRFLLFEDKREVELVWNGKTSEVCNIVLPFQVIEQVDEPRAEKTLCRLHESVNIFGLILCTPRDAVAKANQPSPRRLLSYDFDVVLDVARLRQAVRQARQVDRSADPFQLLASGKLLR
jgi:hypothetical protein